MALCDAAKLVAKDGKPTVRVHDLRHCFATMAINAGAPLFVIGKLLGHSDSKMTERYSHVLDQTMLDASEKVGALLSGAPGATVVAFEGKKRKTKP